MTIRRGCCVFSFNRSNMMIIHLSNLSTVYIVVTCYLHYNRGHIVELCDNFLFSVLKANLMKEFWRGDNIFVIFVLRFGEGSSIFEGRCIILSKWKIVSFFFFNFWIEISRIGFVWFSWIFERKRVFSILLTYLTVNKNLL